MKQNKPLVSRLVSTLAVSWMLALPFLVGSPAKAAIPVPMELFREVRPRPLSLKIPHEMNPSIRKWVRHYSGRDRARFDRYMQRGSLYKAMIQDILVEHGVPPEIYYLAMIESGFVRKANSHAQAVGIWQFIAPTARRYGLRVDKVVDERVDVIRSTRAAARYLRDLYREFGSWYLAMAAYNCGEGRVRRVVRQQRTKNFWELARRKALPPETRNYIPKFQAAMLIGRNPQKYGFRKKPLYAYPVVRRVRIPHRLNLAEVARRHNVPAKTLASLNPHLLRGHTPRGGYEIWLPRRRS